MNTQTCAKCKTSITNDDRFVTYYRNDVIVRVLHQECHDNVQREDFEKNGRLTSGLMLVAQLTTMRSGRDGNPHAPGVDWRIQHAMERLHFDVKRFEADAWFADVEPVENKTDPFDDHPFLYPRVKHSLQSTIEDSKDRTIEAKIEDVTVTGQEMAGRTLLELEDANARITLIAAAREQTPRMGMQGIDGTEAQCRQMINLVRRHWQVLVFKPTRG